MAELPGGYGGTSSIGGTMNNIRGNECEQTVFRALSILGLKEGTDFVHTKKVAYSNHHRSDSICEDFIFPNENQPHTLLSVTHSHPSRPGHSNENKTHQNIGETWLFKTHNRNVRHIAYLGGNSQTWLNYVPDTIALFQDYTIFEWGLGGGKKSDDEIARELAVALKSPLKNNNFWSKEREYRLNNEGVNRSKLTPSDTIDIPQGSFRTEFFVNVIQPLMGIDSITKVNNRILRFMLENSGKSAIKRFKTKVHGTYITAIDKQTNALGVKHPATLMEIADKYGIQWTNATNVRKIILSRDDIDFWKYGRLWEFLSNASRENPADPTSAYRFWKERSDHNPTEAAFELLLMDRGFKFVSEINAPQQSEMYVLPNLLYDHHHWVPSALPGAKKTHRRTDFKLMTLDDVNVYVECKSSGGGDGGSSNKHITDRVREQVARSVIHRCSYDPVSKSLISKPKEFLWYYVLDNNWKTPNIWPCKYVNNLEMAGIDGYYAATDLVDEYFQPNKKFPLLGKLESIGCIK